MALTTVQRYCAACMTSSSANHGKPQNFKTVTWP